MDTEEWKPVRILNLKYEVSNLGRVRLRETGEVKRTRLEKGYSCIAISGEGRKRRVPVHRLVALEWVPTVEGKPHVNHKDGVKTNNRMENLEWCTPRENYLHAKRLGLVRCTQGDLHPLSKLTREQAEEAIRRVRGGETHKAVAISLGVGRRHVGHLVNGKRWGKVFVKNSPRVDTIPVA